MKQKAAVRYLLQSYRNPILIFYGIVLLVYVLLGAIVKVQVGPNDQALTLSSLNVSSMIFLFVCGCNAFKEDFRFFLQNGLSRKTQFTAQCLVLPTVALVMAAVDMVIARLLALFIPYDSLFDMLYGGSLETGGSSGLLQTAWMLCLYVFILFVGYLITVLYYRMGNKLKVLVSVGVPVFFALVLPLIDEACGNRISGFLLQMAKVVFGLQAGTKPVIGMLFLLACTAACGLFIRLLQRRAVLK